MRERAKASMARPFLTRQKERLIMREPVATHPEYPGRWLARPSLQGQQNLKAAHVRKVGVRQRRSMLKQRLPCSGFSEHVKEAQGTPRLGKGATAPGKSRIITIASTAFG